MSIIWFLLAVLFFILWMSKKPPANDQAEDYRQGYWDGYRSFGDQIQQQLDEGDISSKQLKKFISDGYPPGQQPETTSMTAQDNLPLEESTISIEPEPVLELTPEQHEAQTVRNLNTMLYVASFLLVAAAAIFVAASMPPVVRLVGLWAVVILFYGAGLLLYKNVKRLRPAAIAFLGTGLAILPFAGFALYLIGNMSAETTWLVTSLLGLVAYFIAAVITKSQLVSYLTMAFVLSLALSSVAVLSAPIVWYFAVLIGVSLLANVISFLKPSWMPGLFKLPIESTGQVVTPLALIASLVIADHMSLQTYELVFGLATAHYLVVWLQTRELMYETIVRLLAHCSLLLVGWDIVVGQDVPLFAGVWLALAALQGAYSLIRMQQNRESRQIESIWLVSMQLLILLGSVLWASNEHAAPGTLANFVTIGVLSILTTIRLRKIAWAIPALGASLVATFIIGRWLAEPVWGWPVLAWIFIIAALSTLIMYYRIHQRSSVDVERFLHVSFWVYIAFGTTTVLYQLDTTAFGLVAIAVAVLTTVFSFVSRQIVGEVIGAALFVVAVASLLSDSVFSGAWYMTATVLISAISLLAAAAVHHRVAQVMRRDVLLIATQIVLVGLIGTMGSEVAVAITSLVIMLFATVVSFSLRVATETKSALLTQTYMASYICYLVIAWFLSFGLNKGWAVLVLLIATALMWMASYVERSPKVVIVANLAFIVGLATAWQWLDLSMDWMILGVAWIASLVLYSVYGKMMDHKDAQRQQICLIFVWVLLGGAALLQFAVADFDRQIAAAGTLMMAAGTLAIHGYIERNRTIIELSVYIAALGAQRIIGLLLPELNVVFYAHVWAGVIGLMAWWRQHETGFERRIIIAMGIITAVTGVKALEEGGDYQLLFLVEHIGLLIIGALTQKMWAVWWGVTATVLAVLYFLRDYPYIALAFLGLVLIGIVISRLMRTGEKHN